MFPYVFSVLQALEHGQVVVPGVFGADPAHVLPTGRLLRELPATAAPHRGGPVQRHRFPLSHRVSASLGIIRGVFGVQFASISGRHPAGDEYQQQQSLHTSTRRHLHGENLRILLRPGGSS